MNMAIYPVTFYFCGLLLLGLMAESLSKLRTSWAGPGLAVYLTVFAWYFIDPIQSPEEYERIPPSIFFFSYVQVTLFVVAFRWALPRLTRLFCGDLKGDTPRPPSLSPQHLFWCLLCLWVPLVGTGILRMDGDVVAALFPFDARTGINMWSRNALGGSTDSLVSLASYLYVLVCALLGITTVLQRNSISRFLNLGVWLLSVPYFLLSGARSTFVAAVAPCFLCFLICGRPKLFVRVIAVAVALLAVNRALLVVIENRNIGFRYLYDADAKLEKDYSDAMKEQAASQSVARNWKYRQEGLNMIQELCFIDMFSDSNVFEPSYGLRYLMEILNIIPRALWPSKPTINIDYSIWRGFGSDDNSLEAAVTISTGVVGGGVMNFGKWFGPPCAGILMAAWASLLARWWWQRRSTLRLCLFLAGLGLTFNMGRDITLLVLWPIVLGYGIVRVIESSLVSGAPARRALCRAVVAKPARAGEITHRPTAKIPFTPAESSAVSPAEEQ